MARKSKEKDCSSGHTCECDLLTVGHPLVHAHFQNFPLPIDFATVALFASQFWVNALSLPLALTTHGLDLLHHSGAKLLDSDLHSGTAAVGTLNHCAGFAADTWKQQHQYTVACDKRVGDDRNIVSLLNAIYVLVKLTKMSSKIT